MNRPADTLLDPRARLLLRTLISRYIRDGEPVGSQTLARHAGLDVSSATIRSILSELEDVGLLSAPHTSAGRIPTSQGYRVFVDSLLQIQPLGDAEVARLRAELPLGGGTNSLLGSASKNTFHLAAPSAVPADKLTKVEIPIGVLDCKACRYAAYSAVAKLDGVERATVSAAPSAIIVWIDATKTKRETLADALKKARVDVLNKP